MVTKKPQTTTESVVAALINIEDNDGEDMQMSPFIYPLTGI